MRWFALFFFLAVAIAEKRVLYGEDDRQEALLNATADCNASAIVPAVVGIAWANNKRLFEYGHVGGYTCPLCEGEPFAYQPQEVWCSGFLVTPEYIATAAHCIERAGVAVAVFNYAYKDGNSSLPIQQFSVLLGDSVIVGDWGLWDLGERVRIPALHIDNRVLQIGEKVIAVGHPLGLPMKVDCGGKVRATSQRRFEASVDTYGGSSGSPIALPGSNRVVGMLQGGNSDFVLDGNCCRSRVCNETRGCPRWEIVSRPPI